MTDLTGKQIERLCDALIAAFDRSELEQLTRIDLEENLEAIAGAGKLSVVVFDLVTWAQRTGRVVDLLAAVQTRRPTDAALAALAQELDVAPAAKPDAPSSAPGGVSVGKVEGTNVGLGTQIIDQRGATFYIGGTKIDTGGGAYVGGNVDTGGGNFVGRDANTNLGESETKLISVTDTSDVADQPRISTEYANLSDESLLNIIEALPSAEGLVVVEYLEERLQAKKSELQNRLAQMEERKDEILRDRIYVPENLKNRIRSAKDNMADLDRLLLRASCYRQSK